MALKDLSKKLYAALPEAPGVYLMRAGDGELLYIGKAANLKRRVSSYFLRPHDGRIQKLVSRIRRIDHYRTDTAVEALILEAKLIKEHQPPFNIREKDDTSFLYVVITKDVYSRVLLVRGKDLKKTPARAVYGPFTSTTSVREALRMIRRIFPYNTHPQKDIGAMPRPCFDAQIGLCPGTCVGGIGTMAYQRTIRNIKLFFEGKKDRILTALEKDMKMAAKKLDFEKAGELRRQIFSLRHIQDIAFISEDKVEDLEGKERRPYRVEGYDISNISGTSPVGSMVVFTAGVPDKAEYRTFRIKSVTGPNDTAMLREVVERRFNNDWPLPDLLLIDGGLGQVSAVRHVLRTRNIKIPVVGLAKGPERKRNDLVGRIPPGVELATLIRVRDEAHRFAIAYHRKIRMRNMLD